MKITKLNLLLILGTAIIGSACASQDTVIAVTGKDKFTKIYYPGPAAATTPPRQLTQNENDSNDEPRIFYYFANSDYVVEASLIDEEAGIVGKVEKKETRPDIYNLEDNVAAFIYSFRTEKILCSRNSFLSSPANPLPTFEIFVRVGTRGEFYKKGQKYLFFLKQIPDEEKLWSIYEIEKDKKYFRPFDFPRTTGTEKSIFPSDDPMHGAPTKGIINMSDTRHQALIGRIEKFCSAMNEVDKNSKIKNLKKLARSDDEELKTNAIYAIKTLQTEGVPK